MRMVDLISKKRDGFPLSKEEISFIIKNYTTGAIPDYQMSAWAMTVFYRGMNQAETADLTMAMVESGKKLDLSSIPGKAVDKHSTGGVGDKVSLILAPMVAACGVPVAKMSGRGLGHTGGTIDKLSAIPGFKAELDEENFLRQVREIGVAIIAQSQNLVPADKKLYALRDVTGTVNSIPLIASSVMSKKIAAGAQGIVLDVKYGSGAFMKTLAEAQVLAGAMVEIGKSLGRKTIAVLSDMDQPLGKAIGNSLEVLEAVDALQGKGPADLMEVCLELGSWMLVAGDHTDDLGKARQMLVYALESGAAWRKFLSFVEAQGGDQAKVIKKELPLAAWQVPLLAQKAGYVRRIDAYEIGLAAMKAGAGRATQEAKIDLGAGILLNKKIGERVEAGEALAYLYTNGREKVEESLEMAGAAFAIDDQAIGLTEKITQVVQ